MEADETMAVDLNASDFKDEAGLSDDENRPLGRKKKTGSSIW